MTRTLPSHLVLVALCACGGPSERSQEVLDRLDLGALLAPDQARAGWVGDDRVLWGGISAEARAGDIKIYNHKVQFAVQGIRDGSYYIHQGGHVVDADIVRPKGEPGRDLVDEWLPMAGIGRLIDPHTVEVVDDGRDSGVAVVRATGGESPLALLNGAVEADASLVTDLGLKITHTYTLPADSWFLEVTTQVEATDTEALFNPGDVLMGAFDAAKWFGPRRGFVGADTEGTPWSIYLGDRNEGAVGLFSATSDNLGTQGTQVLNELIDAAAGFSDEAVRLQPGESMSWSRYYGVGPDPATLSDAWMEQVGLPYDVVDGVVDNPNGPVEGARVVVLADGDPWTLALTDANGAWSARVPKGAAITLANDGRGTGMFFDDRADAAPVISPYLAPVAREVALEALRDGRSTPMARGMGTSVGSLPLGAPAVLRVTDASGSPFEVRLDPLDPLPELDERLFMERESHYVAGWTADGQVDLLVEPGRYQVVVHRGPRYEHYVGEIELQAGITSTLPVTLARGYEHPGWLFGDPHVHASPSPDGEVAMEHRLMNMAGVGVQLHFGTDHDHVADYTGLLEPLGLSEVLNSVVATEMSPVLRGHLNLYPLVQRNDLPNGGAWEWWRNPIETTDEQMDALRDRHGGPLTEHSGFVIQSNHPESGLLQIGGWSPGVIERPDSYSEDFDAIEVLNSGRTDETLEMYLDLVNRGYTVTPVGVSDSHSLFGGGPGYNGTFLGMGTDDPAGYTPDGLREAMANQRTIVSRGLFLDLSIDPGSTVSGPTTLDVTAHGATWTQPDEVQLWRDGELLETVEGASASFTLAPEVDASYVVMAAGDASMAPMYNRTPWAMAAAIKVDVDGGGWTAPLPPLEYVED